MASRAAALLISLIGRNENGAGGGLTLSRETIVIVLRDLHLLFDPTHRYYQYPAKRVLSKVQSVVDKRLCR